MRRLIAFTMLFALWMGEACAEIVHVEESQYNSIIVERNDGQLFLHFGHDRMRYTQTVQDLNDHGALPVPYTRYLTCALAYVPRAMRIAEIGAASAQTSSYVAKHLSNVQVTAVELDGAVLRVAETHFGLAPVANLTLVEGDGRIFLDRSESQFDIILVDAYRGPFVPFHLTTREFFQTAASRLADGGALALNIEPVTMLYEATLVTLASVFDHVDLYTADGNIVAIAYDGAELTDAALRTNATVLQEQFDLRYPLAPMLAGRGFFLQPASGGPDVLTDDFAPVEFLHAIRRHNRPAGMEVAGE